MQSLSPPEHEHSAAIDEAARWLVDTPNDMRPKPLLPAMRERFRLAAKEACEAIAEANRLRASE